MDTITRVYNRKALIDEVAEKLNIYPTAIEEVYDSLEESVKKHLLEAEESVNVEINFMNGLKFYSTIVPEHYHVHPTKDYTLVPEKIKVGCKFTDYFKKNVQETYNEGKKILKEYFKEREKFGEQWEKQKANKAEREKNG